MFRQNLPLIVTGGLVVGTAVLAFVLPWMGAVCLALVALALLGLLLAALLMLLF